MRTLPGSRRSALITITVFALACVALLAQGAPTPAAGAVVGKPAVPGSGAYFGLWLNPASGVTSETGVKAAWAQREADMGRPFDIGHSFYPFTTTFPSWREAWHIADGRIPMISWNGIASSQVVAGQHDALIRQRAQAVKALNVPVFLRYFWEPEAQKKLAISESPAAYIANWRHVYEIWQAEGVTNAAFVWCPTAWGFATGEAQKYYPGDDVVDWICSDGYNWGPSKGPNVWNDWKKIYQPFYDFSASHPTKPLMAGEYGTVERDPGQKPAWYTTAAAQIKAMPRIKAIVSFDSIKVENGIPMDWRPDSTPESWASFRAFGNDPYFDVRRALPAPTTTTAPTTAGPTTAALTTAPPTTAAPTTAPATTAPPTTAPPTTAPPTTAPPTTTPPPPPGVGTISGPDGPVAGATVRVMMSGRSMSTRVLTDATGRYTLPGLSAGTYNVWVTAYGFTPRSSGLFTVSSPADVVPSPTLVLERAPVTAGLHGRVTAPDGTALGGTIVRLWLVGSAGTNAVRSTTAAADGTWRIADVPAGEYRVQFAKPGAAKSGYLFSTTTLVAGAPSLQVNTEYELSTGFIAPV